MNTVVIPHIIEQHLEEAAFLWLLRDIAVQAPHYKLRDLTKLDSRVEAHIDGLRVAGAEGWSLCQQALQENTSGGLFAATVLALENHDPARINQVVALAEAIPKIQRGLFSAFGWVSPQVLRGIVKEFLDSDSPFLKRIGIIACALHRVNPGSAIESAMTSDDPLLQALAFRTAGELGRGDLLPSIFDSFPSKDKVCQFWAAWAAVLLGNRGKALETLNEMALTPAQLQTKSLQLVLRVINGDAAKSLLKNLIQQPDCLRQTIRGAGITGDPYFIPWLIRQMEIPLMSRLAGESFSMITGVDIAKENLEGKMPEDFQSGPTDDPMDDNVAMDEDENLPWPDPKLLQNWWDAHNHRFQSGHRYLAGQLITIENCQKILSTGYQRQRIAAALEISLQQPGTPLFEWRAPSWRQQQLIKHYENP